MRILLLPLALCLAACSSPARDTGSIYHFRDGGGLEYRVDDELVLDLRARDGRLVCNGVDTGPYEPMTPVRILSAEELLVGGERRPLPRVR